MIILWLHLAFFRKNIEMPQLSYWEKVCNSNSLKKKEVCRVKNLNMKLNWSNLRWKELRKKSFMQIISMRLNRNRADIFKKRKKLVGELHSTLDPRQKSIILHCR